MFLLWWRIFKNIGKINLTEKKEINKTKKSKTHEDICILNVWYYLKQNQIYENNLLNEIISWP